MNGGGCRGGIGWPRPGNLIRADLYPLQVDGAAGSESCPRGPGAERQGREGGRMTKKQALAPLGAVLEAMVLTGEVGVGFEDELSTCCGADRTKCHECL